MRETAEKVPEAKDILLQKANQQDKKHQIVLNKDEYLKVLKNVDDVLEQVEKELSGHVNGKQFNYKLSIQTRATEILIC